MSDLSVEVQELFELARGFDAMSRTLHQGDAGTYFAGCAQAYADAALALRMLAAVKKAEAVVIPVPGDPAYRRLHVSPDLPAWDSAAQADMDDRIGRGHGGPSNG